MQSLISVRVDCRKVKCLSEISKVSNNLSMPVGGHYRTSWAFETGNGLCGCEGKSPYLVFDIQSGFAGKI